MNLHVAAPRRIADTPDAGTLSLSLTHTVYRSRIVEAGEGHVDEEEKKKRWMGTTTHRHGRAEGRASQA